MLNIKYIKQSSNDPDSAKICCFQWHDFEGGTFANLAD